MASPIDDFRQKLMNRGFIADSTPAAPATGGINYADPFGPPLGSGSPSATIGQMAVYGPMKAAAAGIEQSTLSLDALGSALSPSTIGSALKVVGAIPAAAWVAYDVGMRGFNTAIGGSVQAVGDYTPWNIALRKITGNEEMANPLYRDGFQLSDIGDTFRNSWGNDVPIIGANGLPLLDESGNPVTEVDGITVGNATSTIYGRSAINVLDAILPADVQSNLDKAVEEDTARAIADPLNTRGLFSWMTGLHSEFNVYDKQMRDSAFGQGAGRWISGGADAAAQWWLAPEVIGLKAAGLAGRSLFLKSINELGDINKARQSIQLHAAWKAGEEGGKATDFGRLLDSLVRMSRTQVARHEIAQNSTDTALVARTFGDAKTYEEAADRFLAMSGDLQAIDRVFAQDKVLGDAMRMNVEHLAELKTNLDGVAMMGGVGDQPFLAQAARRYQLQADRTTEVLEQAVKENKQLETALAGLSREAGLPDAVRFGEVKLSKLKYGPNSVRRMENKALNASERAAGRHLWRTEEFKTGGSFGRQVRVWQSAYDYMKTNRIRGFARLTDSNDVIAEMDASIQTLPMFRALQKQYQGEAFLPGTQKLVSDFRAETYDKLISARTATERMGVWQDYERQVFDAMAAHYGVDAVEAGELLGRYKGMRDVVLETAKAKGLIVDDGEINIIPEMQALLAEGMPVMDFHFMEQILRLERGSGARRVKSQASLKGSRGLAAFDALWRPLVLMRLGYTVRNVSEGGLRELAAYGTLGSLYQVGDGTRAIANNSFARWASGFGRGVDRVGSMRYGSLRNARNNLNTAQSIARHNRRKLKDLEDRRDYVSGLLTKLVDTVDERARRQILRELQGQMESKVGVTWENVTDMAYAEVDRLMREAQEIIAPVDLFRPLFGGSGRRSKTVTGFDTVEEAQLRAINENSVATLKAPQDIIDADPLAPNPAVNTISPGTSPIPEADIKRFLSGPEREQWDEINAAAAAGTEQDWQAQLYGELLDRASARAVREAMRNGDTVVRTVDPSSGLYQLVHSPADVMSEDVATGAIAVLPKESVGSIQYVRANVYGDSIDLRLPKEVSVSSQQGKNLAVEVDEDGEKFFAGELDHLNAYLSDLGMEPLTTKNQWKQATALENAEALVRTLDSDPAIAEAVALRQLVAAMPKSLREDFEDSGLLLTNAKLKNLMGQSRRAQTSINDIRRESEALYDQIVAKATDPDYWAQVENDLGFPIVMHTGAEIRGGKMAPNPVNTESNVNNFMGAGMYFTRDGQSSTGYFFTRVMEDETGTAAVYAIPLSKADETRYLNVDELVDQDLEEELRMVFGDMWETVFGRRATDDDWLAVDEMMMNKFMNDAFPLHPMSTGDGVEAGDRVSEFMWAMKNSLAEEMRNSGQAIESVDYAAEMAWVDAVRQRNFVGVRHQGGQNLPDYYTKENRTHDVFVSYGDGTVEGVPELIKLEDMTSDMVHYQSLVNRLGKLEEKVSGIDVRASSLKRMAPWSPRSLNAAYMSEKNKAILAEMMKKYGIGRINIDDAYSPSGYQMLTSPDMVSVSTDQVDAILPSGVVGKDFIDNALPTLEREAAVRNPAVLQSGNLPDEDLMQMFGDDTGIVDIIRGRSEGTPEQRALLTRGMEMNGYTHVQIGASDSNKFTNVSELVGNRKTGSAYGAMIGDDVVAQRRSLLLANDDTFSKLEAELGDMDRLIQGADDVFRRSEMDAKSAAGKLSKRLGKRGTGQVLKSPLGSGVERFRGDFNEFQVDGPFSTANQGSLNASLASSGDTVMANLYGFTDYAMRSMRKSQVVGRYHPGTDQYFPVMSETLNRFWRNDMIGMAIIRGQSDEEIIGTLFSTKQGRAYLRDVEGFKAYRGFVDADRLTEDAREELTRKIVDMRVDFHQLVPDEQLRTHLADHEVTSDYLRTQLGWRTDLKDVVGSQMVYGQNGIIRNTTGAIMHVLGTLPENALVRHPFYRARWRDEMQRQADLYASQGIEEFSEAQLNAMNLVSKKFALKQTNETLYTIQRLSTPAHIFKFVMPFFPAWASTMRFWMLRMPLEQPQNVARYAMLYNAPESAGIVQDENGNKVPGQDNIFGKAIDKAFGNNRGDIVIRMENEKVREITNGITGGLGQLRLSKSGADMMLQGETFWFPGLHIYASVPMTWMASQRPDIATALETGNLKEIPFLGDLVPDGVNEFAQSSGLAEKAYRAAVPFGMPTKEKDFFDVALEQIVPGTAKRVITSFRGMGSAEFANAAKEINRSAWTEYDLNGQQGPAPDFQDAVHQTQKFFWFRAGASATLPFPTRFQSNYQFYIDEGRRIDQEVFDNGGTYDEANAEFIRLYGTTFFRYTQSLSAGGSGMSSTVGEFREYERDPELMANLASIGDDASFITMATRPFAQAMNADGFDAPVYAWQMNRMVDGTNNKYLRGGQTTELPEDRSQRELGWMTFNKVMEQLTALAAARGTEVDNDPALLALKQQKVTEIAQRYGPWFEAYKNIGGGRYIQSNEALKMMADSGYFEAHKDHPYAQTLKAFYEGREEFVQLLQGIKASGGSSSLDAKSNQGIRQLYLQWVEKLRAYDTTGNFGNTWDRFFESDPLQPIPTLEVSNG